MQLELEVGQMAAPHPTPKSPSIRAPSSTGLAASLQGSSRHKHEFASLAGTPPCALPCCCGQPPGLGLSSNQPRALLQPRTQDHCLAKSSLALWMPPPSPCHGFPSEHDPSRAPGCPRHSRPSASNDCPPAPKVGASTPPPVLLWRSQPSPPPHCRNQPSQEAQGPSATAAAHQQVHKGPLWEAFWQSVAFTPASRPPPLHCRHPKAEALMPHIPGRKQLSPSRDWPVTPELPRAVAR